MSQIVWTGLHGLIGTDVELTTQGRTMQGEVGIRTMQFGIVWGSIIPDVDVLSGCSSAQVSVYRSSY